MNAQVGGGRFKEKQDICIASSISPQIVTKCYGDSNICPQMPDACLQEVEPEAVTPANRTWRREHSDSMPHLPQRGHKRPPSAESIPCTLNIACEKGSLHFGGFLPQTQTLVQWENGRQTWTGTSYKTSDQYSPKLSVIKNRGGLMRNQHKSKVQLPKTEHVWWADWSLEHQKNISGKMIRS